MSVPVATRRRDWFQILRHLMRAGIPMAEVGRKCNRTRKTVQAWGDGSDPKESDARIVLALYAKHCPEDYIIHQRQFDIRVELELLDRSMAEPRGESNMTVRLPEQKRKLMESREFRYRMSREKNGVPQYTLKELASKFELAEGNLRMIMMRDSNAPRAKFKLIARDGETFRIGYYDLEEFNSWWGPRLIMDAETR